MGGWVGVREAFFQTGFSTRHWRAVLRETLRGSWETEEGGKEALEDNAEGRVGKKFCSLSFLSLRKGQRSNKVGRGMTLHSGSRSRGVGHGEKFELNFHQRALNPDKTGSC